MNNKLNFSVLFGKLVGLSRPGVLHDAEAVGEERRVQLRCGDARADKREAADRERGVHRAGGEAGHQPGRRRPLRPAWHRGPGDP